MSQTHSKKRVCYYYDSKYKKKLKFALRRWIDDLKK
jgi:hypothetical protein